MTIEQVLAVFKNTELWETYDRSELTRWLSFTYGQETFYRLYVKCLHPVYVQDEGMIDRNDWQEVALYRSTDRGLRRMPSDAVAEAILSSEVKRIEKQRS